MTKAFKYSALSLIASAAITTSAFAGNFVGSDATSCIAPTGVGCQLADRIFAFELLYPTADTPITNSLTPAIYTVDAGDKAAGEFEAGTTLTFTLKNVTDIKNGSTLKLCQLDTGAADNVEIAQAGSNGPDASGNGYFVQFNLTSSLAAGDTIYVAEDCDTLDGNGQGGLAERGRMDFDVPSTLVRGDVISAELVDANNKPDLKIGQLYHILGQFWAINAGKSDCLDASSNNLEFNVANSLNDTVSNGLMLVDNFANDPMFANTTTVDGYVGTANNNAVRAQAIAASDTTVTYPTISGLQATAGFTTDQTSDAFPIRASVDTAATALNCTVGNLVGCTGYDVAVSKAAGWVKPQTMAAPTATMTTGGDIHRVNSAMSLASAGTYQITGVCNGFAFQVPYIRIDGANNTVVTLDATAAQAENGNILAVVQQDATHTVVTQVDTFTKGGITKITSADFAAAFARDGINMSARNGGFGATFIVNSTSSSYDNSTSSTNVNEGDLDNMHIAAFQSVGGEAYRNLPVLKCRSLVLDGAATGEATYSDKFGAATGTQFQSGAMCW